MANNERVRKVGEQIKRELVTILPDCVRHDKISLVSFTGIDLSRDFKFATIYITLIGNSDDKDELIELLNHHKGEIRFHLAKRLSTRTIPAMTFKYDESVEYGAKMETLLTKLVKDIPEEKD